MTTKAQSLFLC